GGFGFEVILANIALGTFAVPVLAQAWLSVDAKVRGFNGPSRIVILELRDRDSIRVGRRFAVRTEIGRLRNMVLGFVFVGELRGGKRGFQRAFGGAKPPRRTQTAFFVELIDDFGPAKILHSQLAIRAVVSRLK